MSANVLLHRVDLPTPSPERTIVRVGLLGCGVVGSPVVRRLTSRSKEVAVAAGAKVELARVAVRHLDKPRSVSLPPGVLCDDAFALVDDPTIDIVVEVIGGVDLPSRLIRRALANGKTVVTANKELVALEGPALAAAAHARDADLLFEAAVGGAIPIIAALRDRLGSAYPHRITGVVNGTTNFILDLVAETDCTIGAAVTEAQRRGYAEADPRADLDGRDAAAKIAILASLAFGAWVPVGSVARSGIDGVRGEDIACARALGYEVKLVARAERRRGAAPVACVSPALVPSTSSLGRLRGVDNEVIVECEGAGPLAFRGAGAGGDATATAVIGDVVAAARNLAAGTASRLPGFAGGAGAVRAEEPSRHFLCVETGKEADGTRSLCDLVASTGATVSTSGCMAHGEAFHAGLVTDVYDARRIDTLRAILEGHGYRTGAPLPIVEVA